ncbi:MAG: hypothetical protein IPJ47_17220 [Anaerolineales bacterium]|nr:hypothetical protein [Anaerolineales bacterium]
MTIDQGKILTRLLEVTRSLDSEVDLESNFRSILSAAVELTGSETALLLEYDEASLNFFSSMYHGFTANQQAALQGFP